MENIMCYECKESTVLKEDYNEGDLICTECGLVLDSHLIDLRQEWRASELDLSSGSRARAEKSPGVFSKDAELFTTISMPNNKSSIMEFGSNKKFEIMNLERKYGVLKHRLNEGVNVILTMGDKLALVKTITQHAIYIYNLLNESKALHGVNNSIAAISCLYTACQLEKNARTFKEIVAVADNRIKIKTIFHMSKRVSEELQKIGYTVEKGEVSPTIYARRFCSNLQMSQMEVKAILETITNSKHKLDIRRNPTTVVAAIIFMITQLSTNKRNLMEISKAADVSEKTILATYKEISPFVKEIVPQWFQNQLVSQN